MRENFINELNSLLSFDLYREKLSKRYAEMEKRGQLGQRNPGAKKASQVEFKKCFILRIFRKMCSISSRTNPSPTLTRLQHVPGAGHVARRSLSRPKQSTLIFYAQTKNLIKVRKSSIMNSAESIPQSGNLSTRKLANGWNTINSLRFQKFRKAENSKLLKSRKRIILITFELSATR